MNRSEAPALWVSVSRHRGSFAAGMIAFAIMACGQSAAAEGAWKFEREFRGFPILSYIEDGKVVFLIGCGRAFGLHAKYPATAKKHGKATITLANAKTKMKLVGEFQEPDSDSVTTFLQWDLGFPRQGPELYGETWDAKMMTLLQLLEAGPITVSAEGKKYQIPTATIPDWKAAFEKCS